MKFCPSCKRLLPKGKQKCSFCSSNNKKEEDKRRGFIRVPFEVTVDFQPLTLDPQGTNLEKKASAKDLSLSGIYVEINKADNLKAIPYIKVSNILWVEFPFPGEGQRMKVQGEIKRLHQLSLNKLGLGVMFVNISRENRRKVDQYISDYWKEHR